VSGSLCIYSLGVILISLSWLIVRWKAFLLYCYTNDIRFSALRSRSNGTIFAGLTLPEDADIIRCSPKSMYRFADYVRTALCFCLYHLMPYFCRLISRSSCLWQKRQYGRTYVSRTSSRSYSPALPPSKPKITLRSDKAPDQIWHSRYQEIIDLEIRYLVNNFTRRVASDFDEMLEKIVAGSMPHSGQVLKLTIKELRTASSWGEQLKSLAS
jgi:hypothetical protein